MQALKRAYQLAKNMGGRYLAFRLTHEVRARTGLLKRRFPINPPRRSFISLAAWRDVKGNFFFKKRADIPQLPKDMKEELLRLKNGSHLFFFATPYDLGSQYDWLTNPDTGHRYPSDVHWTDIDDYDIEAGDIKYVWEKSRFTFLYTIIRHDARTGEDHGQWVFHEILSWIRSNPINCGPNYKCSQEISLRVLNWTFALNFYKESLSLTTQIFDEILHAVYWQLRHVYSNINFSRIAVRNNHAITETLALFVSGMLYPFFPESELWKRNGKKWFEEEIEYQVYEDGSFLQFSMNYHRVVIQLLTWGISLAKLNNEKLRDVVFVRAEKALNFLLQSMDRETGQVPNYGANDGALFFPLSSADFRDFRPQLQALCLCLGFEWNYGQFEDSAWYGLLDKQMKKALEVRNGSHRFDTGGFYVFRSNDSLTFIRCGNHKDRPSQADNLHLDIWWKGENLLHDSGTYKYNSKRETLRYFMGTASHNTVMLSQYDQMEKGARFTWYHWTQCEDVNVEETEDYYRFAGTIKAFGHIDSEIRHRRVVTVRKKEKPVWTVEDLILNKPSSLDLRQLWHTTLPEKLSFVARLRDGSLLNPQTNVGFYSYYYGKKESCCEMVFSTNADYICTEISAIE